MIDRPLLSELSPEELLDRASQYRNMAMYASTTDVRDALIRLAERLETTWIDHVERGGERPSDHAALLADFRHVGP